MIEKRSQNIFLKLKVMTHSGKLILLFSIFISFSSCNNKKTSSLESPAFANLELNRGELLLCGDPNFGEVSFSLSCRYDLRETFDLGLTLIHSFEYAEAEKAFVSILDKDSECLMAYWGAAMSILNHPLSFKQNPKSLKRGEELLKVAKTLTPNNEKEKDYIDAVSIYFKDWQNLDTQTRKLNYESKMEELYIKYPDDVETAVFYSLSVLATADLNDKTYSKQKKSGKILEKLFEKYSSLAKEAMSSGDKTSSENYLQHADHFLRVIEDKNKNRIQSKENVVSNLKEETKIINTNSEKQEAHQQEEKK